MYYPKKNGMGGQRYICDYSKQRNGAGYRSTPHLVIRLGRLTREEETRHNNTGRESHGMPVLIGLRLQQDNPPRYYGYVIPSQ